MNNRHPPMVLTALAGVFLAPLLLAWVVYHQTDWHPVGGLQQGELLRPIKPLAPPRLFSVEGHPIDDSLFHGRWTLLYRSDGACDLSCLHLMDTLRRVHLAQDRSMTQVQRVLVVSKPMAITDKGLLVVSTDTWSLAAKSVYLIDPQGNLVMRYRPGFDPKGLVKDLQRLLRPSGAG